MTPITCPHCYKKNFTDNPRCSHCGKPLAAASTGATTSAPPPPIASPPKPVPPPAPAKSGGYSPPMPMPPPPPAPSPFKSASAPLTTPLPAHLRGMSPPDLEGEVIDTREIQGKVERDFAGNTVRFIFALILLPFQPLMVLATWILGGRRPEERQVVYVVRVQRPDGTIGQARIERDILGATLDVGDHVSIWGKNQSGILIVNRAYNHTVSAELAVRHKLGPLVNKIVLAAIILFFVFICLLLSGF